MIFSSSAPHISQNLLSTSPFFLVKFALTASILLAAFQENILTFQGVFSLHKAFQSNSLSSFSKIDVLDVLGLSNSCNERATLINNAK